MNSPAHITFRNMKRSEDAEAWIREKIANLESLYNHLVGCRVAIERPHRHRKAGSPYHIRIDLIVPHEEIVVKREPSLRSQVQRLGGRRIKKQEEVRGLHKDLRQTINDAFRAAGRRLQDHARRERGDIKTHAVAG